MTDEHLTLFINNAKGFGPDNAKAVEWLKNTLEPMGVQVNFSEGEYASSLVFNCDTAKLKEKQTRNAGRKTLHEFKYLVSDVRSLINKKGAVAAAEELGISKSRMYARLKLANKRQDNYF